MQLRAPDTMPPLARPPLRAQLRPLAPRTAGTRSFGPKCPQDETTRVWRAPQGWDRRQQRQSVHLKRQLCHF